ncbi:beta-lactamase class A [Cytobacillus purgationiresistens]|uniref:Beta-lactamase class A n=2 Tax=Cytobacillus purgationiresistens TaxID=863449 RepID=A0ABU0AIA5_9BACI|nr:beta-lactamase class A [Cytobacillus purgationiresistens]
MSFNQLEIEVAELISNCSGRASIYLQTPEGIIDIKGQEIYSSASLIKIPILIEGYRQYEKNIVDLQEIVPIPLEKVTTGAGIIQALSPDRMMKMIDLMTMMIIVSDNTATNLLINRLGIDNINKCMGSIGLKSTKLQREMMDFIALNNNIDNKTTASDMVLALKAMKEESFLSAASSQQALSILAYQQFLKLAEGMDLEQVNVASKTGELPGVQHDCAVISHGDRIVYVAVLIDGLEDQEMGRHTIVEIGRSLNKYVMGA